MTLKEAIILTFEYYHRGNPLSDQVLLMYAGDLADLDPVKCIDAYGRYRRNPANRQFPLPAQIRELVNPDEFVSSEAKAREVAARIVGAVSSYGWSNPKGAQMFIGPEGWDVVQRYGGWSYICENLGTTLNPTTFQAQLRDQLEGSFKYGLPAIERAIGVPPANVRRELTSAEDILKLLVNSDGPREGA